MLNKKSFQQIIAGHEFESGGGSTLLMYVGGGAGTGKSETVKALQEYFVRRATRTLCLSASTGTAGCL
jgi:predicted AAA+ superfamily ATPase